MNGINTQNPYASLTDPSNLTRSGADKYPNPFFDIASEYMPNDIYEMFGLAEYLWNTMPPFKEVGTKVVCYFITDFEFEGGSDDERDDLKDFFDNTMHLKKELVAIGQDRMVYGQSFVSVYMPFDRFLICPDCDTSYKADIIQYRFNANAGDPHFECECPKCKLGYKRFKRLDRKSKDKKRVRLIRWNPKHMSISFHPISGRKAFYLDLSRGGLFCQRVKEGDPFFLNDTPWDIVKVVCAGNQKLFMFKEDAIYHLADESLSGYTNFRGWAIPPLLTSFKLAYYVQLLRRYDEAFVMDFIMPYRVMYPDTTASNGDMLTSFNMGSFVSQLQAMVARKRKNITDIQIAPCKIGYQLLGGEGKAMSPKDNVMNAMNEILNNSGYAAQMYNGDLAWQAAPVALRLFERRWISLVDGNNDLTQWVTNQVCKNFGWSSDIKCKFRSVTLADDLERKALGLQAAAGGDISKSTAYAPFGFDFKEEQERVLEEQKLIAKLQQDSQEEQEASQLQGGAPAQGGDPSQQAGYSVTMDDVRSQSQDLANQLLFQVPEGQRRGQLMKIKQTNPTLHALTIQAMDELRRQMNSQGGAMLMQQQQQAAAAGQMPAKTAADLPSPELIRLTILAEVAGIDLNYMRKLASDIDKEGVRKAFSFVHRLAMFDSLK